MPMRDLVNVSRILDSVSSFSQPSINTTLGEGSSCSIDFDPRTMSLTWIGRTLGRARALVPPTATRALSVSASMGAEARDAIHTGQRFDPDDIRNVRFVNRPMEANPQWAIDLVQDEPIRMTDQTVVSCDGGGGALGHPRVYINVENGQVHACIYCGIRYQMKPHQP